MRASLSLCCRLALLAAPLLAQSAQAAVFVTLVQGLGGQAEYDTRFDAQRLQIEKASQALSGEERVRVFHGEAATREDILAHIDTLSAAMSAEDRLILYLIGHGSFDGDTYKFNIPGPDLSSDDLHTLFSELPGDHHVLVNTSSTSGALLEPLADLDLLLVTATRSGTERNATEFGSHFARALSSDVADIDKNERISLQEAFDYSERAVADFFESAGKLATEHAQLQGENAGRIELTRLSAPLAASDNGALNALLQERNALEDEIANLQLRRGELASADYNRRLRDLILRSATLNNDIEALEAESADSGDEGQ